MNAAFLLERLCANDIRVRLDGADVILDAPRRTLTEDVKAVVRKHKTELIQILVSSVSVSSTLKNPETNEGSGYGGRGDTSENDCEEPEKHQTCAAVKSEACRVRTTTETCWHEQGRGYFTLPAGTEAELVNSLEAHGVDSKDQDALHATRARDRREGRVGFFISLAGQIRVLEHIEFEFA